MGQPTSTRVPARPEIADELRDLCWENGPAATARLVDALLALADRVGPERLSAEVAFFGVWLGRR
jgi:hypothetical protein